MPENYPEEVTITGVGGSVTSYSHLPIDADWNIYHRRRRVGTSIQQEEELPEEIVRTGRYKVASVPKEELYTPLEEERKPTPWSRRS